MTELELPLRDQLALERTVLANRRTWLAYARTALALFVTGATFLHLVQGGWGTGLGSAFIAASVPTLAVGWVRYRRLEARLARRAARAMAASAD